MTHHRELIPGTVVEHYGGYGGEGVPIKRRVVCVDGDRVHYEHVMGGVLLTGVMSVRQWLAMCQAPRPHGRPR